MEALPDVDSGSHSTGTVVESTEGGMRGKEREGKGRKGKNPLSRFTRSILVDGELILAVAEIT